MSLLPFVIFIDIASIVLFLDPFAREAIKFRVYARADYQAMRRRGIYYNLCTSKCDIG